MELPKKFSEDGIESIDNDVIDFGDNGLNTADITPLKPGGSNFKTHSLKIKSNSKILYRPSIGGGLFSLLFFVVGSGLVGFNLFADSGQINKPSMLNFILLAVGLVFVFIGGYMVYFMFQPRVFDKTLGYYYKAYKFKPHLNKTENQFKLSQIIAIQLIGETIADNDGSYGSFELNLVLKDKSRRNVIDHGYLKSIIDDAHILSDFLDVPIWHAETSEDMT